MKENRGKIKGWSRYNIKRNDVQKEVRGVRNRP